MGTRGRWCGLAGCWLGLAALAPDPQPRLAYDLSGLDGPVEPAGSPPPPNDRGPAGPGRLGYDFEGLLDDAAPAADAAPRSPGRSRPALEAAVALDIGAVADSNFNNGTDLPVLLVDYGNGPVPVPLGPAYRQRSGIGAAVDASASVDLQLAGNVSLGAEAEASLVDHQGGANDDASLLVQLGPEVSWNGGSASVQLIGFQRWYGGTTLAAGGGLRGELQLRAGPGASWRLLGEARRFDSDYGPELDGSLLSASLSYEAAIDAVTSAAAGLYLRRQWLGSEAYSSTEVGAYGGATRYLGPHVSGSLSLGLSRATFDAATPWLAPEARRDWRFHAGLSARTRTPLLWRLHPSVAYNFARTVSNVPFYDADRHVLRLGLGAAF